MIIPSFWEWSRISDESQLDGNTCDQLIVTIFNEQCWHRRRILLNKKIIGNSMKFSLGYSSQSEIFAPFPLSFDLQILPSMYIATICFTFEWIIARETGFYSLFFITLSTYRCHIFRFFTLFLTNCHVNFLIFLSF